MKRVSPLGVLALALFSATCLGQSPAMRLSTCGQYLLLDGTAFALMQVSEKHYKFGPRTRSSTIRDVRSRQLVSVNGEMVPDNQLQELDAFEIVVVPLGKSHAISPDDLMRELAADVDDGGRFIPVLSFKGATGLTLSIRANSVLEALPQECSSDPSVKIVMESLLAQSELMEVQISGEKKGSPPETYTLTFRARSVAVLITRD